MSDFDYMEGSTFEKYAKAELAKKEGLEGEIQEAEGQQETRETTPPAPEDWEARYKELEVHNSQQAQELGDLRSETIKYQEAFDTYLTEPTPPPSDTEEAPSPITSDDLFERPDEAINQAIQNHPAILEAQATAERNRRAAISAAQTAFSSKHPEYQETVKDPAFGEWVKASGTRLSLAQRADQFDFDAADALFTLYESEQKLTQLNTTESTRTALEQATLESAGVGEPPPEAKFSRREMREVMIRARQGHQESERYLEVNLPKYRAALAAGEVTD